MEKWNSSMGSQLHLLQLNIAMRGIALLKVGGRMVYSTCSMNPVENEAIISEILRRTGNSVELLDVSNELPALIRRPGLTTWKVQDGGSWFQTHDELSHDRKNAIAPSMFPSSRIPKIEETIKTNHDMHGVSSNTTGSDYTSKSIDLNFPLEQCMRIVPHDQNSGAFFIAVLHKMSPFNDSQIADAPKMQHLAPDRTVQLQKEPGPETRPSGNVLMHHLHNISKAANDARQVDSQQDLSMNNQYSKDENLAEVETCLSVEECSQIESDDRMNNFQNKSRWKGVDPVLLFRDQVVMKSIISFFGIKESFPLEGHLVTRSADTDSARRIYYISKSVQEVLKLNAEVGQQLKIASLGLKMFERHRSKDGCSCAYRLSYEGLPLLLPYISKRILYASPLDFHRLLKYRTICFGHFVDTRLREEATSLMPGCCVVVLFEGHKTVDSVSSDPPTIAIVCWRGKGTMNVMVSPSDRKDLIQRMAYRFGLKTSTEDDENSYHKISGLDQGRQ